MIDANDKQTQSLSLDEQTAKGKRGRPATGKALSNAERQRAYRERQKAQRNENTHRDVAEDLREMLAQAIQRAELAEQEVEVLKLTAENDRKDLALKDLQLREWIRRAEDAERELALRDGEQKWHVELRIKGTRRWIRITDKAPFDRKEQAEAFVRDRERLQKEDGLQNSYRVAQA